MLQAHIDDRAEIRKAEIDMLMQRVRELGRYPRRPPRGKIDEKHAIYGSPAEQREWKLACDVFTARRSKLFSPEQEAELEALQQAERQAREAVRIAGIEEMMQEVRGFGRYPMESRQDVRERQLADKLRKARKAKRFSPAQDAELQVLQQAARDARAEARIAQAEELMQQKLCDAWTAKKFSPEQEAELKALQEVEIDSSEKARQGGELLFCQKRKR